MLWLPTTATAVAGAVLAGLAVAVWHRRRNPAGLSLAALLVAVAWWSLAYALELVSGDVAVREAWGDAKYAGVAALPPAWLTFVLQYTGRAHLVTRTRVALLAVEPVVVLVALAVPATHDLVRSYPQVVAAGELPVVRVGPVFWVHFVYSNALLVVGTALFVTAMARLARAYWRLAAVLLVAAALPWAANLLHNFGVGPFARLDLTPSAFTITGAVLVWGLHQERLVNLSPVARSVIVDSMADPVIVLDVYGRVLDVNPAAAHLLGGSPADLHAQPLTGLLPRHPALAGALRRAVTTEQVEVALPVDGRLRHFDARRQPLTDKRGRPAGELVVLRDITERKAAESQLRVVLAERSRVAAALQQSLVPAALARVPGLGMAARYEPAGDGREIGGDFYDVFALDDGRWAVVLGDVSGKGAEAASVTALIRYTLRALASAGGAPSDVLLALNEALLRDSVDERYATLAYAVAEPHEGGWELTLCLAGHHPPLLRRADGCVEPVGRPGTALGLIDEPELSDTTVHLRDGELLCLFTDGLLEARRGRDFFGEHRAMGVLRQARAARLDQAADLIAGAARGFAGGPLSDDLALLLLRAEPAVPGVLGAASGGPAPAAS